MERIATRRRALRPTGWDLPEEGDRAVNFPTTSWTIILSARDQDDLGFRPALERLCRLYWYPVYAYVRRHGHSVEDAQDLTQEFFARLIEKRYLQAVNEERGRFRWFLLAALKRFLANEWNRDHAQKRGGDLIFLDLEREGAEGRYLLEPGHNLTPERIFERRWGLLLLERVLYRLREEQVTLGSILDFESLRAYLMGEAPRGSYGRLARDLGVTEGAVKVAVHRMRRRFGQLLRAEIRDTVASEQEIDDEIRFLADVVRA